MTRFAATFLAATVSLCGCASSTWERTERFSADGVEGRLYVPRIYAPLLPGSIYPDRKTEIPTTGRPALVVVCPEKDDCRRNEILEQAGRRGMVVLVLKRPPSAPLKNDLLRTRAEADGERIGLLLVKPTGLEASLPSSPSKQIFLSPLLFSLVVSDDQPEIPAGATLKLYAARPSGGLPNEAFRDAVEWLAAELLAR